MVNRIAAATAIAILSATAVSAQDIEIVCTLTQVMDRGAGDVEADTGTAIFVISPQADGTMAYKVPFHCVEGTLEARMTDTEMTFRCDELVGAVDAENHATIDRATGEYVNGFALKGYADGMVHMGSCDLSGME